MVHAPELRDIDQRDAPNNALRGLVMNGRAAVEKEVSRARLGCLLRDPSLDFVVRAVALEDRAAVWAELRRSIRIPPRSRLTQKPASRLASTLLLSVRKGR